MSFHAGNADLDGADDGGWFFGSFMAGRVPALASEHVEVKWARRCLVAAAVFVLLAAAAGLVAWGVMRH